MSELPKIPREELNSLKFVVQYRYRDWPMQGHDWITMAAYDVEGPAVKYADECTGDGRPWIYRACELEDPAP